MPELPEVQTIVNDLNKKIIGRRITDVWFDIPKMISIILGADKRGFLRKLEADKRGLNKQIKDLRITEIKRRGKNILIYLNKKLKIKNQKHKLKIQNFLLLIHQKLTGHLLVGKWRTIKKEEGGWKVESLIKGPLNDKVNTYIHLIFYLDNGWMLGLSDLRKFAKVVFGPKEEIEKLPDLAKLGPEPLDKSFKVEKFKSLIVKEKRKIKEVLMDQKIIAGIGNIYSDEILWQAKIHPLIPANKLRTNQLRSLYRAMWHILQKALKLRGTSISDYRDTSGKPGDYAEMRLVYQREGESCQRCKTPIKRIKINGRSAHYCPKCQK